MSGDADARPVSGAIRLRLEWAVVTVDPPPVCFDDSMFEAVTESILDDECPQAHAFSDGVSMLRFS